MQSCSYGITLMQPCMSRCRIAGGPAGTYPDTSYASPIFLKVSSAPASLFTSCDHARTGDRPVCSPIHPSCGCASIGTHRMEFACLLPVCLLYLFLVCGLTDSKKVIIRRLRPDNHAHSTRTAGRPIVGASATQWLGRSPRVMDGARLRSAKERQL